MFARLSPSPLLPDPRSQHLCPPLLPLYRPAATYCPSRPCSATLPPAAAPTVSPPAATLPSSAVPAVPSAAAAAHLIGDVARRLAAEARRLGGEDVGAAVGARPVAGAHVTAAAAAAAAAAAHGAAPLLEAAHTGRGERERSERRRVISSSVGCVVVGERCVAAKAALHR